MSGTKIIAEIGVNHDGDMTQARTLIDVAADAGADFVKFQTFQAEKLTTKSAKKPGYQLTDSSSENSQFELLKRLELSPTEHQSLVEYCQTRGVQFLSTAFDNESLRLLIELDVPILKVPSGEITNLLFLRQVARLGKPIFMSTGMATMSEVHAAVSVLTTEGVKKQDLVILQCTTDYPTRFEDVNLRAMLMMREKFGTRVGLSDHTLGIEVSIGAVALGAVVIEKHITLSRSLPGPDHRASLEPKELEEMVRAIRNIEKALGKSEKKPSSNEKENRRLVRKSIVARNPIQKGEKFSESNITVKRPGSGLSPMEWDNVLGKTADKSYVVDEIISCLTKSS